MSFDCKWQPYFTRIYTSRCSDKLEAMVSTLRQFIPILLLAEVMGNT